MYICTSRCLILLHLPTPYKALDLSMLGAGGPHLGGPLGCCLLWAAGFNSRLQWVLVPLICADEVGGGG